MDASEAVADAAVEGPAMKPSRPVRGFLFDAVMAVVLLVLLVVLAVLAGVGWAAVAYGGMGAAFAWVYMRTGTLWAATGAHASHNLASVRLLMGGHG